MHANLAWNRALKSGIARPLFLLFRDTAIFNLLVKGQATLRNRLLAAKPSESAGAPNSEAKHNLEAAVEQYTSHVVEIRDLLRTRRVALLVAAFPHPFTVFPRDEPRADRIGPVKKRLANRGIAVIDLSLPLRESGLPLTKLFLFPDDGHASPLGNAIAAEALAPHVQRAFGLNESIQKRP
jgi:lysophospholipase L1-like esterase